MKDSNKVNNNGDMLNQFGSQNAFQSKEPTPNQMKLAPVIHKSCDNEKLQELNENFDTE